MKKRYFAYVLIIILFCSSCNTILNKVDSENSVSVSSVELILHSASEENEKWIGTGGVSYTLQIKNHSDFPVEFTGFLNEHREGQSFFAFSPPNAAHLIAPDGQDLFAVYSQESPVNQQSAVNARDGAVIEQFDPLRVEANSDRWQSIVIGPYADLTQAGTYTFWIELEDNFGQLHQSSKVSFTLKDVNSSIALESLDIDLKFEKDIYKIEDLLNLDVGFEYGFRNKSEETVSFLRRLNFNTPVQNPIFQLIIRDANGHMIPKMGSDASSYVGIDELEYIVLSPGEESYQMDYLPHFPGMRKPGEYHIQLVYIVHENDLLSGEPMDWDENVFTGRLESNEAVITITE